jgi:hypothetical protein
MALELGEVIVEREFESKDSEGNTEKIKLRLGKPYFDATSTHVSKWRCPFQLVGIGQDEKIKDFAGIDGLDAMFNTLIVAEEHIQSFGRRHNKKITWLGGEELGLHPPTLSELQNQAKNLSQDENSPFKKAFDEFFHKFSPMTPPPESKESE